MILLICIYIISLILSWILIRDFEKDMILDVDGFEVFICLMPLFNTMTVVILSFMKLGSVCKINWNKFFLLKK